MIAQQAVEPNRSGVLIALERIPHNNCRIFEAFLLVLSSSCCIQRAEVTMPAVEYSLFFLVFRFGWSLRTWQNIRIAAITLENENS